MATFIRRTLASLVAHAHRWYIGYRKNGLLNFIHELLPDAFYEITENVFFDLMQLGSNPFMPLYRYATTVSLWWKTSSLVK